MRKFLILALGLLTFNAFAQTAAEEAIILNQELQFLEDSINNVQAASINTNDASKKTDKALNEPSLERTYFGEDNEEDSVNTRSAGPKRRGF
jgi:lipid II:glycine glycyltransferase (peptidoglycan interpeptide bridge formation enzyme)